MIRHIAELKLDQQIADLGFLDQVLYPPRNRLRAADDDLLRSVELLPILHVAQEFTAWFVAL